MLYLIDIHWHRRQAEQGRSNKGRATYPMNARNLQAAKNKAIRNFNRHLGLHLAIDEVSEFQDPAGILTTPTLRDCGSGQDYGVCQACGRGHGAVVFATAH